MLQQVLAISLVLGLLVGTLFLLRRAGVSHFAGGVRIGSNQPRQMRVLERIVLAPHHSLHLVSVQQKIILLAVSPSGCHKIEVFPTEEKAAEVQEFLE